MRSRSRVIEQSRETVEIGADLAHGFTHDVPVLGPKQHGLVFEKQRRIGDSLESAGIEFPQERVRRSSSAAKGGDENVRVEDEAHGR